MKKRGGEKEVGEEREMGREKERVFVFFLFLSFFSCCKSKTQLDQNVN